jgi:hypothetical protein
LLASVEQLGDAAERLGCDAFHAEVAVVLDCLDIQAAIHQLLPMGVRQAGFPT